MKELEKLFVLLFLFGSASKMSAESLDELDAKAATKIMGWVSLGDSWASKSGLVVMKKSRWNPSSDPIQALTLLEILNPINVDLNRSDRGWFGQVRVPEKPGIYGISGAYQFPEALTRLCVIAKEL